MTPTIDFADDVLQAYVNINSSIILLLTSLSLFWKKNHFKIIFQIVVEQFMANFNDFRN